MSDVADDDGPALVPELLVADVGRSLAFWCDLCGFRVRYHRLEEGFAYLVRGSAHVMLEEVGRGRNWVTADLARPLGRGINFQVGVDDVEPVLAALRGAGWPLFVEPEEKAYRVEGVDVVVRQFLVTDPDGYLLRFQAHASG
jgi:catechol 2,3-dioxygenase-like lactoylglutathione lyase family enzyme